jgi:threonine dehydratase
MNNAKNIDLSLANIERAASIIDPVFRGTPQFIDEQLCAALGRRTIVKVETANPIRSFKGRGADFLVHGLDPRQKIACASAGNFGQGMAYAGRARGIAVEVFVPTDVNPSKVARMKSLGATVTLVGEDFGVAKEHARRYADEQPGRVFVEDGDDPAISEGAGTIGVELLKAGAIDTIVLPVGDGALITGIATWVKQHSPLTKIIGVCPSGGAAMFESWKAGRPVAIEKVDTIADGIAVRVPVPRAVELIRKLVDEMVVVSDSQLLDAMRLAASTLGLLLEPSGAAGLAAIRAHALAGEQLATVLTGSNVRAELVATMLA